MIDLTRCRETVQGVGMGINFHQCTRKTVVDGWCKQHSPEAKTKRSAEQKERWAKDREAQFRKYRPGRVVAIFEQAIEDIAAGHDDPRERAGQALTEARKSDAMHKPHP